MHPHFKNALFKALRAPHLRVLLRARRQVHSIIGRVQVSIGESQEPGAPQRKPQPHKGLQQVVVACRRDGLRKHKGLQQGVVAEGMD